MWSRLSVFGGSFADNVKPKDNTAANVREKVKDVNSDGKSKEKLKDKGRTSKLNSVSPSQGDGENSNDSSDVTLKPKSKSKSTDLFGTIKRKTTKRKKKKSKTTVPPSSPSDSAFELASDPSKENTPPGERNDDEESLVISSNSIPSPIQNAITESSRTEELTPILESSIEETTQSQSQNDGNSKLSPEDLNISIINSKEATQFEVVVKPRKIKKSKENSQDEEIREITFFYSEEDERFTVRPKKNPMAILLGIDSLIKFTKYFSDSGNLDDGQLPWNSFEFVFDASVSKECENPNLKSPDLLKFFNKFGPLLTRVRFNFTMFEFDYDVTLIDDEEKKGEKEEQEKSLSPNPPDGLQFEEFIKILCEKLPNVEILSLSGLPSSWKNSNTKISRSSLKLELPELETLILEKYVDHSKHKEILSLLLKSAPNLNSLHNFQLGLLDLFKDEGKLGTIKDIELVHPTFLSQSIWMVEDYFEILGKFTDLVSQQEIKLEHLLVIPDEGFTNSDDEVNSQFSGLYTKILEGSKDTLKTWSIYPVVASALPVLVVPSTSSSSQQWSMAALTTLKLYEFGVCQKGVFKLGTIFKDPQDFTKDDEELKSPGKNINQGPDPEPESAAVPAVDSNLDMATMFPKLTKVELAASKFFQKYDHSLSKNSSISLKFPTVTELDLNLGSSRPSVGAPFLYNLFDLFRELSITFPNVIHLKIRCYQKIRYVLRALAAASPGFKDMKSLYIQAIEVDDFINEFRRRDPDEDRMIRNKKKSRGNNNSYRNRTSTATSSKNGKTNNNTKKRSGREELLINAFLDIIMDENEEPEMIQIDMDKIRTASQKKPRQQYQHQRQRGHGQRQRQGQDNVLWPLSGLLGLGHLTVGMASHDLDHLPYFEGYRLQGPINFNLLQVSRIKDNMDLDTLDLEIMSQSLTESELMGLCDYDSDSDDVDYERYFGLGFGTDYFCSFEGVDPYEVYQKELERKMDFAMFMNGDSF